MATADREAGGRAGTPRALLACGPVAGVVFTLAWIVGGATRAGYDPGRHAISSLSIGEAGWLQIASFLVTGALSVACAVGLRGVLREPPGSRWGPVLVGVMGIGLIGSGVFVTDPLNGYPPGTPVIPTERTTHGILHDLFGVPFFLGLPITGFVFARLFGRRGERGWAAYSALSGIGMFAVFFVARLSLRPGMESMAGLFGVLQRITVTIGFAWLALIALHFMRAERGGRGA